MRRNRLGRVFPGDPKPIIAMARPGARSAAGMAVGVLDSWAAIAGLAVSASGD
jgi:hypothetical protein